MKLHISFTLLIFIPFLIFSIDIRDQNEIHKTRNFTFYSEDEENYGELISLLESYNSTFSKVFDKSFTKPIKVYIYKDQDGFDRKVNLPTGTPFGFNGKARPDDREIHIVSYQSDRDRRDLLLQTAVHELVHIYYGHWYTWANEGMAHYMSGMLRIVSTTALPDSMDDLNFRGSKREVYEAYHFSAWIIQYIYEVLCLNDPESFLHYLEDMKLDFIGYEREEIFFDGWKEFMLENNYVLIKSEL